MSKSIIDDPEVTELFEKDPLPDKRTFARMIVQAGIDPLPLRELGEPFDFKAQPKWRVFDNCDFTYINSEVPLPNADVDLFECFEEYKSDVEQSAYALNSQKPRSLSFEKLFRINRVMWDWHRFWAYRHFDPAARRKFADEADEMDTQMQALDRKMLDYYAEEING